MSDRIRVKPLQWHDCTIPDKAAQGEWRVARCLVGMYEIHTFDTPKHDGVVFLSIPNNPRMAEHGSVPAAQQAAQSDFERRILDVIE